MSSKKIAFITGANRGLGFETARELGEKGVHVILGARKAEEGASAVKKLQGLGIESESFKFDVNTPADHQNLARYIEKTYGHLDILVNNAGIFRDADDATSLDGNHTSETTQAALRETFDANFFNLIGLTQTLLPLIRKSSAGRIVNLSSILGSLTLHADHKSVIAGSKAFAYNASKTALNAFTIHLAHELRDTNIKVNSAHPGWVKTDMGGPNAMMEVKDGGKTSAQLALLEKDGPTGGFFHDGHTLPW